ncbi:merozoite surface protein [Reticulomyxa filosa]|uniref:Merozoite surface protein n=1 Tax=Reticulomyxa filosa TaxID=46433 RepID=X6NUP6_RETFI|nr:merozoite surface protein [Reticulomyxa filosa]|eukprot:ETO29746.1 merozoite surface protein [Reticulomyxa filosa]
MAELQTILASLNAPPLELDLTLVQLDSKTYVELLEIVFKTLSHLQIGDSCVSTKNGSTNEPLENEVYEWVKLLNYPPCKNNSFEEDFKSGKNKDILYSLLHWIVTRSEELKTRIYVVKNMKPFDLPQEFFVDPGLN